MTQSELLECSLQGLVGLDVIFWGLREEAELGQRAVGNSGRGCVTGYST